MDLGDLLLMGKPLRVAAQAAAIPPTISPRLTAGEVSVLDFLLDRKDPCRIGQIAAHTGLAQSRVSTLIQKLLKRGWVKVATDVKDRRATTVQITQEVAGATRKALSRDAMAAIRKLVPGASEAELRRIERGLATLAATISRHRRDKKDHGVKT